MHELRLFFVALQFLTRLPVPKWVGYEPAWLNASARHFPGVGLCVGAIGAMVLVAGETLFAPIVAVGLSMAATVWLTGAFHEDGLADTLDALGGHVDRERALTIMKDSRIGTYGAISLMLVLGLKAAVLSSLPLADAVGALLLGHCLSRAASVALIRWLPYAGDADQAKARPLARLIPTEAVVVGLGWVLLVCIGLLGWRGEWLAPIVAACIAAAAGTLLLARWFVRRLGGITGDTLGATQQLVELLILLSWLGALGIVVV